MPGIPRSRACQSCKARRVKCDLNWPTCKPCRDRGVECSGPSSLVKFVHGGHNPDHKGSGPEPMYDFERGASGSAQQYDDEATAYYSSFRVEPLQPRQKLTTTADRTAARLANLLESPKGRTIASLMPYLDHIPARMSDNSSLRDTVLLFCSVCPDIRGGQQSGPMTDLREYSKAIRSLRRVLANDDAVAVETLASVTLLLRTEYLFNPQRNSSQMVHERGMISLLAQLGPPNPSDELYMSLLHENYKLLIPYWIKTGENNFLNDAPWREAMKHSVCQYVGAEELDPYIQRALNASTQISSRMPDLLRYCYCVRSDPYNPRMGHLSSNLGQELLKLDALAEKAISRLFNVSTELEEIVEQDDARSLVGSGYQFSSIYLAHVILLLLNYQLSILRMRYDLSDIYGAPDTNELYMRCRDLSIHAWKYIPFMRSLDSFIAPILQPVISPTFDFADAREKGYLLDATAELSRFRQREPVPQEMMEEGIRSAVMFMTGQLPID